MTSNIFTKISRVNEVSNEKCNTTDAKTKTYNVNEDNNKHGSNSVDHSNIHCITDDKSENYNLIMETMALATSKKKIMTIEKVTTTIKT